jgi:membrane fusion protein (multidrug efflux system)
MAAEVQSANSPEAESTPPEPGAAAQTANGERRRRRRRLLLGIVAVFVIGVGAYLGWWLLVGRYYASTDDAYVGGNRLMLTPQIAGTVVTIHVEDTDRVAAGQPLVELDRSNERVAMDHAQAALGEAVRSVRELYEREAAEDAALNMRRTALLQARQDFERASHLVKIHGVTLEQYQHAQSAYRNAQSAVAESQHSLAALEAQTEGPSLRQTPKVQLAVAQFEQAYLNLQRTTIPAPAGGYVAQRSVQIGERVKPGDPLLAIVPLDQLWVDANFKETEIGRMRLGQPVRLTADQYGGDVVYHGRIAGISAGTGSAFELLPPQNATGNWIKIVRRVPVRIALSPEELRQHPLRIGLSMSVRIDVHDLGGRVLAAAPPRQPVYRTDVYRRARGDVAQRVDRIIDANGGDQVPPALHSGPAQRVGGTAKHDGGDAS